MVGYPEYLERKVRRARCGFRRRLPPTGLGNKLFSTAVSRKSKGRSAMKLKQIVVLLVLIVAGLFLLVFLADLALKIPFERTHMTADIFVVLSAGLIIWQGLETWFELKTKKK
jgi:hypothetical protein